MTNCLLHICLTLLTLKFKKVQSFSQRFELKCIAEVVRELAV